MIKLDADGVCTVVITCAACPFWAAIRLDMETAHECSTEHERVFHPEWKQAREAARKWRQRQTAK